MKPDEVMGWVELYGNASALAAISLCAKDKQTAANFQATAEMALSKVRAAINPVTTARTWPGTTATLRRHTNTFEHRPDWIDVIPQARIDEIAKDAVVEAVRDLIHDRMGQSELLSDDLPEEGLTHDELEAECDRLEAAIKLHLPPDQQ